MTAYGQVYKSASGFTMNINHNRPLLTPTSRVIVNIRRANGFTHIDLQVQSVCEDLPQALTKSQHETVEKLLLCLRKEASRATKEGESEGIQNGIMYVIQALQVRLNQHWHAVQANKEVGLDELFGLLTVDDDTKAEENVRALMEVVTVEDKKDEATDGADQIMETVEQEEAAENEDRVMKWMEDTSATENVDRVMKWVEDTSAVEQYDMMES